MFAAPCIRLGPARSSDFVHSQGRRQLDMNLGAVMQLVKRE